MDGIEFESAPAEESGSDQAQPEEVRAAAEEPAAQRNRTLTMLQVTLGLGLAVAILYIAARAVANHAHPGATEAKIAETPKPAQKPTAPPIPSPEPSPVRTEQTLAEPHHGEIYLQAGAYGRQNAEKAKQRLSSLGFNVLVAPGPDDRTFRVLVGPLTGRDEMNREASALADEGIETIPRKY